MSDLAEFLPFAKDRENCLLFKAGSTKDMADKITEMLKNPELAKSVGKNAKDFSDEHWSWSHAANTLKNAYTRLANKVLKI